MSESSVCRVAPPVAKCSRQREQAGAAAAAPKRVSQWPGESLKCYKAFNIFRSFLLTFYSLIFVATVLIFHSFTMTPLAASIGILKGELWVKKDNVQASPLLWRKPDFGVKSSQFQFMAFWGISPPVHSSKTNHIKYKSSHVQSLHLLGENWWWENTQIQWASVLKRHMHCGRCILKHRIL